AQRTAVSGEDVALTARFRAFFEGLRHGKVNRDELTDAMNAQLTATALPELAAQLAPLGALRSMVYLGKTEQPLGTAFRYTGIFTRGDLPLTFSLDKNGKIAGVVTR